jgi:hypothetical protein
MNIININDYRIERLVDELFGSFRYGENRRNPVTGNGFIYGDDPTAPQKDAARRALLAREWFAIYGPADAQPLPLWCDNSKALGREGALLRYIVRLYERSLGGENYDMEKHPPFADYVSGVLWEAERVDGDIGTLPNNPDELPRLKKRFPPRELAGMGPGFHWSPPKLYAETMPSHHRSTARIKKVRRAPSRSIRRAAAEAGYSCQRSGSKTQPEN